VSCRSFYSARERLAVSLLDDAKNGSLERIAARNRHDLG
jgi:hypothetical protein